MAINDNLSYFFSFKEDFFLSKIYMIYKYGFVFEDHARIQNVGGGGGAGISMFVKEGPSHIFILYYFLYYFYIILVLYHKYVISDSDRSRLTILSRTYMYVIYI